MTTGPADVVRQARGIPDELVRMATAVPVRFWLAAVVLVAGVVAALAVGRICRDLLDRLGIAGFIEGTAFDRIARDFGTSAVAILRRLVVYSVVVVAAFAALSVARVEYADRFWNGVAGFLPQLFVAFLVALAGLVVGDKVEIVVSDRLKGVKLPETGVVPTTAKYSVFYVAALIALSQLGVATLALVVLLGAYVFALVVFGAVAFKRLLASAAAGVYLLLNEPYGIGDEVRIAGHQGVVQEVDLYVTRVENDGEEYIVPNATVFSEGVVRVRG
ncbi:MAG: mechanosensitive ion channel family protein [Haloferacaceae archaeon]